MSHFYGWGSTVLRLEPLLRGGSFYFLPLSYPEIPGTHLIDLGMMKGLIQPWSSTVVLNTGPLEWESSV